MKRFLRIARTTLILLTLLGIAGTIVIGWIGSSRLISPPRRLLQDYHQNILSRPDHYGLQVKPWEGPHQTPCLLVTPSPTPGVASKSRQLRQRLTAAPDWGQTSGTVILLHGHRGRKEDHLPICERFCAAGFRCLLLDLPAHGEHPEPIARFGFHEISLVEEIADAAAETHDFKGEPIFLFGVSQGGAIALQTAGRNPDRWAGVISVAAFESLDLPLQHAVTRIPVGPLGSLIKSAVSWTTRARAGFSPEDIRPIDAAAKLTTPAMIIHGEDDSFISCAQGQRIYEAIPSRNKQWLPIAGAGHGRVLAADAANTYAACCEFMLEAAQHR